MNKCYKIPWGFPVLMWLLMGFPNLQAQNFNRPVPLGFPQYEFQQNDTTALNSYYLFAPYKASSSGSKYTGVLDENGYLAWWTASNRKTFDFKAHPGSQLMTFTRPKNQYDRWHYVMDANFMLVDSFTNPYGLEGDIHDFQRFSNGNYAFSTMRDTVMDLSAYTFNGIPGGNNETVIDWWVFEYDAAHNLVFEWHALDWMSPAYFRDGYPHNTSRFDIVHGNSIALDDDGNFLFSFRFADACLKVDRQTGQIIWTLGGNFNDFTFVNDSGFVGQHDIRRLANGNVSLFDNRLTAVNTESRGVEYTLDTLTWTATKINEFHHDWPVTSLSMGNYNLRNDGFGLVGWGNTQGAEPAFTLHDPNLNQVSSLVLESDYISYRSFFQELDFVLPRPEISCQTSGNDVILSAPMGSTYYLWSNGEFTPSITVSDTGTYMVWVDYGIGMVGSEPYFLDAMEQCSGVGMEEVSGSKSAEITAVYDLLGRSVQHPEKGHLYLVEYGSGARFERVVWRLQELF